MTIHTLHIGINDYRGTASDLAGCVNDARDCERLFGKRRRGAVRDALDLCPFFGKADTQRVLVDREATRPRVLAELQQWTKRLAAGDWGVLTWSSHGTYVRDGGRDEADGFDEALVTADLDVILDDELGTLLERRTAGSRLIVQTDACHSGTATRSIGPRLLGPTHHEHRLRFLPPNRLPADKLAGWKLARMKRTSRLVDVIHFGACTDRQFAADTAFDGRANGAFTYFWIDALLALVPGATFGDWAAAVADRLPSRDFEQAPQTNAYKRALDWKIPQLKK